MTLPSDRARISFQPEVSSLETSNELASVKDASFTLVYWDIASVGSTARDLLAYGNVEWKNDNPTDEDWDRGITKTGFSGLPVLKMTWPTGKELYLAESMIVDVFLAERFGLLGENEWEALTIKTFYSNIHYLRERGYGCISSAKPENRRNMIKRFMDKNIRRFIEDHEHHLKQNGSNGHYVGNKLKSWRESEKFKLYEKNSIAWYKSSVNVPEDS
ncbi:Glutathione S-transferase S1 [Lunasporangiospora selenospora]|uniref:Glutathione S-transferase S1 n=1 Tax=Lunasporangiospora selenospora TaxID=979761 RepID=A0A9P6KDD6_9FUNG|nr:Glutathione S-transferase S1 [Lunasporangiospora selenospora]